MKTTLIALISVVLLAPAIALDSKAEAIKKYPELAVVNSPMNRAFVRAYDETVRRWPRRLLDPHWAVKLADKCDAALKSEQQEKAAVEQREAARAGEAARLSEPRLKRAMEAAGRRLEDAPRDDQIQAAFLMKYQQSHPGPMSLDDFQFLTENSRRIMREYVPSLLPKAPR